MSFSSGFLNQRITIARRAEEQNSTFGKQGQPKYTIIGTFWANHTFSKGAKALHEGALDAYETAMFRMRFCDCVDRWCIIKYEGKWYQIQSLNSDRQSNQIQITAIEMVNQQVTIV